ncbi:hypothetical protein ACFSUK_20860 [Sphingobium scionense]|uniref:Uncharacterized protein n=1 Tax=Sphingobium scionense TaxID=1404341 RepID=A0A7W6LSQ0_9SPHN|nr:hypothetical protein [Sphingobium scionense]MBB4149795.1 hypothetical protein [Sphingobium scionense]
MLIRRRNAEDQQLPLIEPDAIPLSGDSPKGGRQAQDASYLSPILLEIERRLRATGMSASRFGRLSVNDPRLVHDLRRGRDPSSRIVARVRAFMAKETSEKR